MSSEVYADCVQSLAGFLSFVEKHCEQFNHVLFRGQHQHWTLLPKLARLRTRRELHVLAAETKMLTSFKSRAVALVDSMPETEWDWLSIAQHHGMATRLLDWTTNPLAALWFAVERPAVQGKEAVVWIFTHTEEDVVADPSAASPFDLDRTRVFQPRHVTRRIGAQHGWFTVHHHKGASGFIPLERNERFTNRLMRLQIPAGAFSSLRFALDRCGINAATLYGDLMGLGRDAEWQQSALEDEDIG